MAARSIFLNFVRNCRSQRARLRSFSSGFEVVNEEYINAAEEENGDGEDDLKNRIFRLRLPKRSATNIIDKWVREGRKIDISDLRHISKELRRSQRYKHALEISEWMVSHDEFKLSDLDYAIRIDLMTKVFGIDAAERYFEALPPAAKTSETYTALLHSFAASKLTEKAEELYEKIKESNLSLSAITYNELMTLYMSVGQLEKVSSVIKELKCHKVEPDIFTYNLWVSSCASSLKISEVRMILDEMRRDSGSNESWIRYVNLVNIYLASGQLVDSELYSVVETDKGIISQREWISYDFLVILHGGLGNKDKLDQIWKSLRMTKQTMTSRNYLCIVSSYFMLGQMKEVGEVIDQWKNSASTSFDAVVCKRLLEAFTEVGLMEEAEKLRKVLNAKGCGELSDERK